MSHEMETGQRKDAQGQTIPAWFIQNVIVTWNGRIVLSAQWGTAVSKNPFLSFKFKGGAKGDRIAISWMDNRGDKRSDEAVIA
jgi:sulfur-oxidizing protein SoxZ